MRRSWAALAGGAALLLGLGAAAQPARPVEVAMPEAGPVVRTLELTGSFTARRAARLSPQVPGLVAEVAVDAGDRVREGDTVVRLDGRLAALAVTEAEALVAERRAARGEVQRLLDESQRLRDGDFVPETEIAARRSQVAIAEAALARAEAALARAEAALASARERQARHVVLAPFDGVIAARLTELGEWVETGTPVAELVDTEELWLDLRAPQRYWDDLGGQVAVEAVADAAPGRTLAARVHRRVPVNDASARTFLIRLVASSEDGVITPGMSARARFEMVGEGEVLRVPRDALIRYPDGTTTVWVVDQSADSPRAREVEVTVGDYVDDQVEVVDGLGATEAVIVRGNEVLGDGDRVRVVGAGAR